MVLFGIIIVAFNFYAFIQVSNAAREGARAGTLYRIMDPQPADVQTQVQQTVNKSMGTLPVSSSILNVTAATANQTAPRPGDQLIVTVIYSYTMPIVAKALPMFPQPIVFRRTVVMEVQ
jgi:Flp pilus assembly protein TadG